VDGSYELRIYLLILYNNPVILSLQQSNSFFMFFPNSSEVLL
jgi:hypothetical protein